MADSARVSIEKLNNKNYQTWKYKLELLLIKEDLWDTVGKDPPTAPDEQWQKRDGKARATIGLLIEDNQLQHVKKQVTAKGMWDSLRKYHERATISSKVFLLKRLSRLKYNESESMESHIGVMLEIVDQLAALGEELKDNLIVAFMLCSLPDSYDSLITALETRPEDDLTIDLVKGKLIQEYDRRKNTQETNCDSKEESALQTQFRRKFKQTKEKETIVCHYCNKPGHLKRDCYKLKNEKRRGFHARQVTETSENPENSNKTEFCFTASSSMIKDSNWYVDSGASCHMSNDKSFFSTFRAMNQDKVSLANGDTLNVKGIGEGILLCSGDNNSAQVKVKDVLFVPDLQGNLLSVKKLTEKGFSVNFTNSKCTIEKERKVVATASARDHLYKLNCTEKCLQITGTPKDCIHIWHKRFGHRNPQAIRDLHGKQLVKGMKIFDCGIQIMCEPCIEAKMTRKSFPKGSKKISKNVLDLVHSDICGPMQILTPSGNRYFLTLIDDFSGYTVVYLLKTKDEALSKFKEYLRFTENKFGCKIKVLRSDRGGEYLSDAFNDVLKQEGIMRQTTAPYTPEQNGVAERKNRTLVEAARSMLIDAKMNNKYWGEAILTANYVQNRLLTKGRSRTPYELWHKKQPNVSHLKVFGCRVYAHVPKMQRKKLDRKAKEYKFVGYQPGTKGYRLLDEKTDKITISRDVTFMESCHETPLCEMTPDAEQKDTISILMDGEKEEPEQQPESLEAEPAMLRRSERKTKGIPPERYASMVVSIANIPDEPFDSKDALSGPEAIHWKEAMDSEMKSLTDKNAWTLTELPMGRTAIGCKWVYKRKTNPDGSIEKYRARLVAKGYDQKYGEDYNQVFAPVAKQTTIRTLLTIAGKRKYQVRHYDVKTAFLNGTLDEEIYMKQPPEYEEKGREHFVCKLHRSIYGLKQSAKIWHDHIDTLLTNLGFKKGQADTCLYSKEVNGHWLYVLLYVDDIIMANADPDFFRITAEKLSEHFEITDLGRLQCYLGIEVEQDESGTFWIHQKRYIQKLLQEFNLELAKNSSIPLDTGYLKCINTTDKLENNCGYRQLIGGLLYIATNTRPDIAAAVSILSRQVNSPEQNDWNEAKRILRYLKGTIEMKLQVGITDGDNLLQGYADANWATDAVDRKSNTGYIFIYNGSTISWCSRKQATVTLSSTEAEYVALSEASQEAQWLILLLEDFNEEVNKPIVIYEDNQSTLKLIASERINSRTKHIDVKYHYLKELKKQDILQFKYCPSHEMIADILTKPLEMTKTKKFRDMIGLKD